ncbi:FAD-binding oxidoreductase [Pseudomonas sp. SWRI79]|uniref:FAD-binding oxidoreductase n=1 Tax=Pseudomonas farris TaxID=2841207 RepID=A0ABS6PP01_9PSED|nr:FAD-dependent oxidoreductase [Pseudomonas farris]MBV4461741.1 FAD-binding oxidoreductase [Pseudomonas farris]
MSGFEADPTSQDAVVVGGGFYGTAIAVYLARQRGLKRIVLVEREPALLMRASYNNQARVHNGYHYPRSFTTAYRSRINLPKFVVDWPGAVKRDFTKLYAIARRNSKVTAKQFERFCRDIGADIQPVNTALRGLFEPRLIEDVFLVEEYAFDTTKLASWARRELSESGVQIRYQSRVTAISKGAQSPLQVITETTQGNQEVINCRYVFNCTYSGLNQFKGDFPGVSTGLKQEITEMALMQMPESLDGLGITVMDGPFFSMMPFPARGLHTLSHVRYTPHLHWNDQSDLDPYARLQHYARETRVDRMVRDVGRYIPDVLKAKHVDSLFEVKTVLMKNEGDDGRPILFERHMELPGCYSILGGKIDNIYDVIETLEKENISGIDGQEKSNGGVVNV